MDATNDPALALASTRSPSALLSEAAEADAGWWLWALVAVTVLGGALRFAALGAKTLWLDEAFSLWMARHDLPSLLEWLVYIDHHPPLYYSLLHLWINWFGDGPAALRSLSALTSTLAIPLYAAAVRKFSGAWVGIVAALLLALSPFHLRYAQEIRMYGVLTLAVALLFFALAEVLTARQETGSRRQWWLWALLAVGEAAAMLTHNTATVTVPLALNGAMAGLWLAQRRGWAPELPALGQRHFWRWWILSQIAALLIWSPWAWAFVRQAEVVDSDFWIEPPNTWTVWLTLGSLSFAYLPDWLWRHDYLAWLPLGLVAGGLWQWRRSAALSWLLLTLWLLPPVIELLASLRRPIFYDRTLIWTTLPYLLLVARGIVWPRPGDKWWRSGWLLLALATMGTLCGLGVWNYYANFAKEDWDKVTQWVAAEAAPQDLVLFNASWTVLPFDYYYTHYEQGAPALVYHGMPADLFDAGMLEPPMTEAAVPRLLALLQDRQQLWLVYSHWWYTDPDGVLLRALDLQMKQVEEQEWPGIRVIRYERR